VEEDELVEPTPPQGVENQATQVSPGPVRRAIPVPEEEEEMVDEIEILPE
jgi:hypothetical protein